ncbi:MAG: hypothetical protein RL497_2342 [Pseudomonadota bacterium]|jgi:hypothetical protein
MRILFICIITLALAGCSQLPPPSPTPYYITAEEWQHAHEKPIKLPSGNIIIDMKADIERGKSSTIVLQHKRASVAILRFNPAEACEGAASLTVGHSPNRIGETLFYSWPQGKADASTSVQLIIGYKQLTVNFQGQTKTFALIADANELSVR